MIDEIIREDVDRISFSLNLEFIKLAGKKILITGANGFIPSYFVDTLLALNSTLLRHNPTKIVLLSHHKISPDSRLGHCLDDPNVTFITGDVVSVPLPEKIDIIIHGASKASPKEYLNLMIETADVNVLGTKRLLEYCVKEGVSKFLFLGSGETYGDAEISPIPETHLGRIDPIGPRSAYQESKRFAETLCYLYHKVHGVNAVIVRLFHTYGPRLSLNDGRVISEFMRRAINGENIEIVDNEAVRTFSYITDSVEAMWRVLLLGNPGEAYNVGSEEEIEIKKLADLAVQITKSRSQTLLIPPQKIPHSIATPLRATPSLDKIKNLGQVNKISLENGLTRLFRWYSNYNK